MSAELFHQGVYRYRRKSVLIVSVCLLAVLLPALGLLLAAIPHAKWSLQAFLAGLVGLSAFGGLSYVSLFLLRSYLRDYQVKLVIDADGIHYAGKSFPWKEVAWLAGYRQRATMFEKPTIQLVWRRLGRSGMDRPLPIETGLTAEGYEDLMSRLRKAISPEQAHVRFG